MPAEYERLATKNRLSTKYLASDGAGTANSETANLPLSDQWRYNAEMEWNASNPICANSPARSACASSGRCLEFAGALIPKRRYLQFSLATLITGVTACCVWLAWQVELARRQKEAVLELHKLHVAVIYRLPTSATDARGDRLAKRLLGAAYREPVEHVGFGSAHDLFHDQQALRRALAVLPRLRELRRLSLAGLPVTDNELDLLKALSDLTDLDVAYTDVTNAGVAELHRALPDCRIIGK